MLKQKEVIIGDNTYIINTLTATKALSFQGRVMKLLGRSAAEFMMSAKEENMTAEQEAALFSRVAEVFINDLDKIDIGSLSKDLIEAAVFKNSMAINFDKEFSGNLGTLYQLLYEVVKFNYIDVFINLVSSQK